MVIINMHNMHKKIMDYNYLLLKATDQKLQTVNTFF